MSKRSLIIDIVVPIITFSAGVIVPILFDRLTKGVVNEQQLTLAVLLGFLLVLIALIIVNAIFFRESHDVQKEVITGQRNIQNHLEELAYEFGLGVEFIVEEAGNEGITYEKTRQLIEGAQDSLVFLDAWVQTKDYFLGTPLAAQRRQAYYDAIIQQIENHKHEGKQFHRRIIQMTGSQTDINHYVLVAGSVFLEYMKKCVRFVKIRLEHAF